MTRVRRQVGVTFVALLGTALLLLPGATAQPPTERDEDTARLATLGPLLTEIREVLLTETVRQQEEAVHPRHSQPHPPERPHDSRPVWQWPLHGQPEVVNPFDPPENRWLPGHRGIDLAGFSYAPVLAVADGTVTYSGSIAGVGIVSVTHPSGIRSTYQPVTERVEEGTRVSTGDTLGYLGVVGSHCVLRTCLHLGAVRGKDQYLDPLLFLQSWELSLLPQTR